MGGDLDRREKARQIIRDMWPADAQKENEGLAAIVVHGSLNIYMHAPGPAIVTASTSGAHGYVDRRRQLMAGIPPAKPPAPKRR